MAEAGPNEKIWTNVPAGSEISISGEADGDNFTITVDEDDHTHRAIVCSNEGVIPGPCNRTLNAPVDIIYRIVITIGGDPGPNVTVRAKITDPDGQPVGEPFATTAPGSAHSPYEIVLSAVME